MLSCFVQYLTRAICRPILFQKISSKRSAINDELTTLFVLIKLIAKGVSDVLCKAGNVYICCSVSKLFKDFPSCPSTTGPHPTSGPHTHIIGFTDSLLSSFRLSSVTECQEHSLFSIILSQSGTAGFVISS